MMETSKNNKVGNMGKIPDIPTTNGKKAKISISIDGEKLKAIDTICNERKLNRSEYISSKLDENMSAEIILPYGGEILQQLMEIHHILTDINTALTERKCLSLAQANELFQTNINKFDETSRLYADISDKVHFIFMAIDVAFPKNDDEEEDSDETISEGEVMI